MYTLQGILTVPVKYSTAKSLQKTWSVKQKAFIDHRLSQSCFMDAQVLQLAKFPSDLVRLLFAALKLYKV